MEIIIKFSLSATQNYAFLTISAFCLLTTQSVSIRRIITLLLFCLHLSCLRSWGQAKESTSYVEKEGYFITTLDFSCVPTFYSTLPTKFEHVFVLKPNSYLSFLIFTDTNKVYREDCYKNGIFLNVCDTNNQHLPIESTIDGVKIIERMKKFEYNDSLPCNDVLYEMASIYPKIPHREIHSSRFWRDILHFYPQYTLFFAKITHTSQGIPIEIAIPNYKYRKWMPKHKKAKIISTHLYYITNFSHIVPIE